MRKLTPREIRLLLLAGILLCIVPLAPILNSQARHLAQVRAHIEAVSLEWEAFKRQNPGFELVKLFAYTGGDGMFGANGYVASEDHLMKLRYFMESTHPPRPVFVKPVLVLDQAAIDDLKNRTSAELGSSANRSQPVPPEANPTSSAAGSSR